MIPSFVDADLLAQVQPLPAAARRQLVKKLVKKNLFPSDVDVRVDDNFYGHLLNIYCNANGFAAVNDALKQIGGNSARRDLATSGREWIRSSLSLDEQKDEESFSALAVMALVEGRADVAAVAVWISSMAPTPDSELLILVEDNPDLVRLFGEWRPWQVRTEDSPKENSADQTQVDNQEVESRPSPANDLHTLSHQLSEIRETTYRLEAEWLQQDLEQLEAEVRLLHQHYEEYQARKAIALAVAEDKRREKQSFLQAADRFKDAMASLAEVDWRTIDRDAALTLLDQLDQNKENAAILQRLVEDLKVVASAREAVSNAALQLADASVSENANLLEQYSAAQGNLRAATDSVQQLLGNLRAGHGSPNGLSNGSPASPSTLGKDGSQQAANDEPARVESPEILEADERNPTEDIAEHAPEVSSKDQEGADFFEAGSNGNDDESYLKLPGSREAATEDEKPDSSVSGLAEPIAHQEAIGTSEPSIPCEASHLEGERVDDAALLSVERAVADSLVSGRPGLAMYFAMARSEQWSSDLPTIPAEVIEGAISGSSVSAPFDRASDMYILRQSDLLGYSEGLDHSSDKGLATILLLWVGALRPAMLPPFSGRNIISTLSFGQHDELYRLGQTVDDIGKRAGLSSIAELARSETNVDSGAALSRAENDLREWAERSKTRTSSYAPATNLWQQRLMGPGGPLMAVIDTVLKRKPGARKAVRELIDRIRENAGELVDAEFLQMNSRRAVKKLETPARQQLAGLLQDLRDLLEAWEQASATHGQGTNDRLSPFRATLLRDLEAAKVALAGLTSVKSRPATAAAATFALEALRALEGAARDGTERRPSFLSSLEYDLLLLPDFPLNGRRVVELGSDDVLKLVDAAIHNRISGTWLEAYDAAISRSAMDSARRIAAVIAANEGADETSRTQEIEDRVKEARHTASQRMATLQDRLEDLQAAMLGKTLDNSLDEEFAKLLAFDLESLPRANDGSPQDSVCDFPQLFARLDQFAEGLDERRRAAAEGLEERIRRLAEHGRDVHELKDLVEAGDLGTLAEELAQVESQGHNILDHAAVDRLDTLRRFSNDVLPAWAESTGGWRSKSELVVAAKNGSQAGPLDFQGLLETDLERAVSLLQSWYDLRTGVDLKRALRAIPAFLGALGFTGVSVEKDQAFRGATLLNVTTDPIASPDVCLVPAFGSKANGRYSIVFVQKSDRAVLTGIVQNQNDLPDRPVIVIVADVVPSAVRSDFLKAARKNSSRAVALIDEAMVGTLAGQPARGLRDAFDLSIPFGVACPYNDRATETSPEMFFGRQAELDEVMNFEGSCLVYGGRQLGKTALLKQAYLRLRGRPERAVAYLDIRPVGDTEPSANVWERIEEALTAEGFAFANSQKTRTDAATSITNWLSVDPERRLLVLLDEADAFLESEIAENFPNIDVMKRLMDTFGRRAKFVFAGLHNVQRFARTPNSPLLHLGAPVNVGPLMGKDAAEARRMVLEPMAAIGIGYERSADAARMLSLVGYYPSLLQTFGKSLVQQLDREIGRKANVSLPLKISRTDLDTCFQNADFRADLVQKFRATLELDRRYELIAYVICDKTEDDRRSGKVADGGYLEGDIRTLALEYWPAGFADDDSPDAFHALLDEMVGLGVLEAHGPHRYALRSARIAAMLGGPYQILEKLAEFEKAGPPPRRDPLANHRLLPNGGRASLPLRREQAFIDASAGVILIGGSPAMGVGDTTVSLESLANLRGWPVPRRLNLSRDPLAALTKVIEDNRYGGKAGSPKLILAEKWPDIEVIEEIAANRILRGGASMRIVLIGLPADIVEMELRGAAAKLQTIRGVARFDMEAWGDGAIRHWLARETEIPNDDHSIITDVRRLTGGFSGVLESVRLPRGDKKSAEALRQRVHEAAVAYAGSPTAFEDVGLCADEARTYAAALKDWDDEGGFDRETAIGVGEEANIAKSAGLFECFIKLSIVERGLTGLDAAGSEHAFRLNPLVRRILENGEGA